MRIPKILLAAFISLFAATSCSKYNKASKSKDSQVRLALADKYFAEKKYKKAQPLYEELFSEVKGTIKFEEVYYKDAYCFYYMKMYRDAESLFKGFLEVFPNSP